MYICERQRAVNRCADRMTSVGAMMRFQRLLLILRMQVRYSVVD